MNLEEERAAALKRQEAKRKREMAELLLQRVEPGSSWPQISKAAIERWPRLSTDDLVEIRHQVRELRKENPEMAKKSVSVLREWVQEEVRRNPDIKSPACFDLAKEAGVVQVAYETFRTQYFYPIRHEVREELGLEEKKEERPKRKRGRPKKEGEYQEFLKKFGSTEEHEKAHQELAHKTDEEPKRRPRRRRPHPLLNTRPLSEVDAEAGEDLLAPPPADALGINSPPPVPPFPEEEEKTVFEPVETGVSLLITSPVGDAHYRLEKEGPSTLSINSPHPEGFRLLLDFIQELVGKLGSEFQG